jgi:hypothetical protein
MGASIDCPICGAPADVASGDNTVCCPKGHYSYTEGFNGKLITERVGAFIVTYRKGDSQAFEIVEELARALRHKNLSED